MHIKNIRSFIFSSITSLLVAFSLLLPMITFSAAPEQCVIDGGIGISVETPFEVSEVSEKLVFDADITNSSSYVLSGVNIGVGLYSQESASVPDYFVAFNTDFMLQGGESKTEPLEVDLSAVKAGEYDVRVAAFQGDELSVFGAMVRGVEPSFTVNKIGERSILLSQEMVINGQQVQSGSDIEIDDREDMHVGITTTNNGKTPVFDTPVVATIIQGSVPLGDAVRNTAHDVVRLIPGGERVTGVSDISVESGEYTVFSFLTDEGVAMPVLAGSVQVGDSASKESWMYISQVGVTDVPLENDSEVVACVEYVGKYEGDLQVYELAGVEFTFSSNEEVVKEMIVTNENSAPDKYFSVKPAIVSNSFVLEAVLLSERSQGLIEPGEGEDEAVETVSYTETQVIKGSYECESEDCTAPSSSPVGNLVSEQNNDGKAYWFYIGIMLVAALLMYIMLRRLPPENPVVSEDMDQNELQ